MDKLLDDCLVATKADSFQLFLTGKGNFRYDIYPEYKATRIDVEKPKHLVYLRDYLKELGAIVADGCEADDLMGAAQGSSTTPTVIVSLDKDMLTVPGNHYQWEITGVSGGKRWVKEARWIEQSDYDANYWFYTQCITGDVADNIKGIFKVGKKGAEKLLAGCETEQEMFDAVRGAYDNDDEFLMNSRCLWIWRKPNDDFRLHFERLAGADDTTGS